MAQSGLALDNDDIVVPVIEQTETVRVDPVTGTVETDRPDGSVVVQLDARRKKDDDGGDGWFDNLADDLDAFKLGQIANDLFDAIQADDRSRVEYLGIRSRGLELLGTKLQEPRSGVSDNSAAVDGLSTVTNPLLLESCLKGWANAQAELLPASGPVKIRDDGDETTAEDDLADAFERDMNHWFTTTAAEYYPDTSHMLLWGVYFGGSGIKKVYRCPMRRRPVSESVDVKDFIVSDTTKDLRACARITHQIAMRPSVMKRMKFIGAYRDATLTQPTPTPNQVDATIAGIQGTNLTKDRPEDQPYTIWESQCELDLDEFIPAGSKFKGEKIPLPYVVTMDKDSREILAIRRDWNEDDEECERKRMYVKYPYVPGPGFYGTGMLNIVGNASAAMTAAWRLSLDNAMLANFPSGLIAKLGARQNTSDLRAGPAQFVPIDTNGLPIGQVVMPNPFKEVGAGMMALIDKITGQAKEVAGTADIPAGDGLQNIPVGTMLANIEQATKIMAAAHKGMHTAQSEEIQLVVDLFRDNPEDFWRSNRIAQKNFWNEQKLIQALDDYNLVPVSDPNIPSHIHRVAKALGLVQLSAMPQFAPLMNPKEVLLRALHALREDPNGLLVDPAPQQQVPQSPPDKIITAQAKAKDADTKALKAGLDARTADTDNQIKLFEAQSKERVAGMDLRREEIIHANDARKIALDQQLAGRKQAHDEQSDARQHARDDAQFAHDRNMDVAGHALDQFEAMKPEPTKPSGDQ